MSNVAIFPHPGQNLRTVFGGRAERPHIAYVQKRATRAMIGCLNVGAVMDNVAMDGEARTAAVGALARLGESSDFRDRVAAGGGLASFAGLAAADDALRRLLLDPEDMAVTRETAFSLARLNERAGLAVVVSALVSADEDQSNWIASGLEDSLSFDPKGIDLAIDHCRALRAESDDSSSNAHELLLEFLPAVRAGTTGGRFGPYSRPDRSRWRR